MTRAREYGARGGFYPDGNGWGWVTRAYPRNQVLSCSANFDRDAETLYNFEVGGIVGNRNFNSWDSLACRSDLRYGTTTHRDLAWTASAKFNQTFSWVANAYAWAGIPKGKISMGVGGMSTNSRMHLDPRALFNPAARRSPGLLQRVIMPGEPEVAMPMLTPKTMIPQYFSNPEFKGSAVFDLGNISKTNMGIGLNELVAGKLNSHHSLTERGLLKLRITSTAPYTFELDVNPAAAIKGYRTHVTQRRVDALGDVPYLVVEIPTTEPVRSEPGRKPEVLPGEGFMYFYEDMYSLGLKYEFIRGDGFGGVYFWHSTDDAYVGMSKTDLVKLAGSRGVLIQSPTTRYTWDYFHPRK